MDASLNVPIFLVSVVIISLSGVIMPGPVTAVTIAKGRSQSISITKNYSWILSISTSLSSLHLTISWKVFSLTMGSCSTPSIAFFAAW